MISTTIAALGHRRVVALLLVVFAVHVLSPAVQVTDSRLSVFTAHRVLHGGDLDLAQLPPAARSQFTAGDYDVVERGDAVLPFFPYAPMVLLVPGVAAAEAAGVDVPDLRLIHPNQTWIIELPAAALAVALATVVMAMLGWALAIGDEAARRRAGFATALTFAFATAAWSTGSRSFWQHTPAMLLVAAALLAMVWASQDPQRSLLPAGAAAGGAYLMRPTSATVVVVLAVWALLAMRDRALSFIAGGTLVAIPFVAVNVWQYGAILPPYFDPLRLGTEARISFVEGLAVHLVSPSRGLLVYTPLLLLVPWSLRLARQRGAPFTPYAAGLAIVVLHWVVVASYGSTGGAAYGARFFTEVTPVLVLLLVPLLSAFAGGELEPAARRATTVLLALSVLLAGIGGTTRAAFCWSATPVPLDEDASRLWDFSDPQMLRPLRDLRDGRPVGNVLFGACASDAASEDAAS